MRSYNEELYWKRANGTWIFGGKPVWLTGKEAGLLLRFNLFGNLLSKGRVLSVGCGIATELKSVKRPSISTLGMDPERAFLFEGKARDNADDLIRAIGEKIPLRDGSINLVILIEVLEHVMNPEIVLEEIHRVLAPKGLLFITVPNRFHIFETHGMQICGKQIRNLSEMGIPLFSMAPNFLRKKFERARIYSEAELVSLLAKHRFEIFIVKYLMPPFDAIRQKPLTVALRKVFLSLSNVPIIKMLGRSIMVLSRKQQ